MKLDIKKILVPVDFSEGSQQALEYGIALAEKLGAQVTVLHVVDYPPPYSQVEALTMVAPAEGEVTFDTFLRKRAQEDMREFVKPYQEKGLQIPVEFESGAASDGIARAAGELGADLVVMGTHGRTGIKRLMIGSVAERTLRYSPCPVLTIPPKHD